MSIAKGVTYHELYFLPLCSTVLLETKPRFIKVMIDPLTSFGPNNIPLLCFSHASFNVNIIKGVNGRWELFTKCSLGNDSNCSKIVFIN